MTGPYKRAISRGVDSARQPISAILLSSVSFSAIVLSCLSPTPACAADYVVTNETELRNAITSSNASGDPSSTIVMANSFSISAGILPEPTSPISIDTQGFTLTGLYDASTVGTRANLTIQESGSGGIGVTFSGTLTGGNAGAADTTAGQVAVWTTRTAFTNNGTITGGAGGGAGGSGGVGTRIFASSSLVNNGTIAGGSSASGAGGAAVDFGGIGAAGTLVNNGKIRGGNGGLTGGLGGVGLIVRAGSGAVTNSGTIEGGAGGVAILSNTGASDIDITNSGTIRAGAGQSDAITRTVAATTGTMTLELQAGSVIEGNVVAGAGVATDTLRLGGTGSDSFDVSAIGPQYQNFDIFQKTGTGTWFLTGTGSAVTDWDIQAGTLAIGNGGTSGSVTGDITNNGTLAFDRSDNFTFANLVTGSGTIRQIGSGTTFLTGNNGAFAGTTSVEAGTLSVNGILGGTLDLFSGGRLQGIGQVGNTVNAGTVAPGNSIGTLTISGDYAGSGGVLEIESVLGDDTSSTDRLLVTGNTSGNTNVRVVNLGGAGGQTVEGIKIVDAGGISAGTFSLIGDYVLDGQQAVVGGAYAYRLYQNGITTPGDGDWYLRSAGLQPGIPVYQAYPLLMLLGLNQVGTLQQRIGDRMLSSDFQTVSDGSAGGAADEIEGVWLRTEGLHGRLTANDGTVDTSHDYDIWRVQGGLDGALYDGSNGRLIGGLTAQFGTMSSDLSSSISNGHIDTSGFGLGSTLTWYGDQGFYADAQSQLNFYDSNLSSDLVASPLKSGSGAVGYILSIETGQRLDIAGSWSVTPQAQLTYSSVDFGSFYDKFGAEVSLDRGASLNGRLGMAVDREASWQADDGTATRLKLYGAANLYYEFLDGVSVNVAGSHFASRGDDLSAGLGLGGSYSWGDERYSVYGEMAAKSSLSGAGENFSQGGSLGVRVKW